MGVYIKGLEMPTERESFNLTIKYNGVVLDTETGMQVAEAYELSPHGQDCRTCVQDCQFIGCYMPNILRCSGYISAEEGE